MKRLVLMGAVALVVGLGFKIFAGSSWPRIASACFFAGISVSASFFLTAGVMILGSKVLKRRFRERLLDKLSLRGDERVLDVGCGRGLMLNGVARRLVTGKAVGIDLWQTQDQSGNSQEATLANARLEGVADRIEIHTADMRQLPFPESSFDAIVSSWAIHNLPDATGQRQALREIARVLKPGGKILIADILHTPFYAKCLRELGFKEMRCTAPNFLFLIPTRTLWARKP